MTTARLTLRAFSENDTDALHQILSEDDVLAYFPNPGPPSRERVQRLIAGQLKHWETYAYGWWAVEPRSEGKLIGWCGLQYLPETDEVEVGYLLDKAFWGRGLATEAARASLRFGFERIQVDSIVAIIHPENIRSRRVIEKLGMTFVDRACYFGMECCHYSIDRSSFSVLAHD